MAYYGKLVLRAEYLSVGQCMALESDIGSNKYEELLYLANHLIFKERLAEEVSIHAMGSKSSVPGIVWSRVRG